MAKRIRGLEVESEFTEYAVAYTVDGGDEEFIYQAENEDEARLYRAMLDGRILIRQVFETAWADAPE